MTGIPFVRGKCHRRISTAEEIFAGMDGIEVSFAGTGVQAERPVGVDLLEWADRVFMMEQRQRRHLQGRTLGKF